MAKRISPKNDCLTLNDKTGPCLKRAILFLDKITAQRLSKETCRHSVSWCLRILLCLRNCPAPQIKADLCMAISQRLKQHLHDNCESMA